MKITIIMGFLVIAMAGCNGKSTAPETHGAVNAEKLVSHGYRKFKASQFAAAQKAYLEAYFSYKDTQSPPTPKLYAGMSALLISSLQNPSAYPMNAQTFIIGDEKELVIANKNELLELSLHYLHAAGKANTASNPIDTNILDEVIKCHQRHLTEPSASCNLINEILFAYDLE